MALKILQPGIQPAGQFDMVDGYLSSVMGGEIGTVTYKARVNSTTSVAAFDALQGYTNNTDLARVAVTLNISENGLRPLWLLDDGTAGYGTLFGQQIGTPTGLSTSGTNLGPHTATGSGKVTIWNKPGIYGTTTDAVDTHITLGLVPANASLRPGLALYPMINGKLTPTAARAAGGAVGADVVARFLEFRTTANTLVKTPFALISATIALDFVVYDYRVEG